MNRWVLLFGMQAVFSMAMAISAMHMERLATSQSCGIATIISMLTAVAFWDNSPRHVFVVNGATPAG